MIEYRKAGINDIEELLKVRIDFLINAKNISSKDEEKSMYISNKDFLVSSLTNGSYVQWIAEYDNKIVGTSSVSYYILPPNSIRPNGKVAYIGNIFTYPQYRKQGIATKLLNLAVEEAKSEGCKEIILASTNMGRPIYEKYGFKNDADAMSYCIL